MVVAGVSTRSRQEVSPASWHAAIIASGWRWVAHSVFPRVSTAVIRGTILPPPGCMWGERPLQTGDPRENQCEVKSLGTRNLHLNFMPFGPGWRTVQHKVPSLTPCHFSRAGFD